VPAPSSSPSALLRAATTAEVPARRLSAVESSTLLKALEAVPDPRRRRGRRHPLQSVLCLALGAVLAGAGSWAAIADWAAVSDHDVGVGRPPHASTIRRLLGGVDVGALEAALTGWVMGRRDAAVAQAAAANAPLAERRVVLAADGKTLRRARQPDGSQTKLVSVYDHASHLVLTQTPVVDGDEIAAFTTALAALPDLQDVVITADALHCQREHATWLRERGGHYLFTVKANQPTLRRGVAALPWAQVSGFRRRQAGHGRTESRSIKVIDLDGHPIQALFPHGQRAIKVVRRRRSRRTGRQSVEAVYAITSLDYRHADPGLLTVWIQGHWGIENRVHHVRDVTQSEDRSHIRAGFGPHVLAAYATPRSTSTGWMGTPTSPAPSGAPPGEPAPPARPSTQHDHPECIQVSRRFLTLPPPWALPGRPRLAWSFPCPRPAPLTRFGNRGTVRGLKPLTETTAGRSSRSRVRPGSSMTSRRP
jgi:predicted transposase YbfD/YdcC